MLVGRCRDGSYGNVGGAVATPAGICRRPSAVLLLFEVGFDVAAERG